MKLPWRILFLNVVLCIAISLPLTAENGSARVGVVSNLFIKTTPLAAVVRINGITESSVSPLLKKELAPGSYTVTVFKQGFLPATEEITILSGDTATLDITLEKNTVTPVFPEGKILLFNGRNVFSGTELLSLPPGAYDIAKTGEILKINARYPGQDFITGLTISLPVVGLLTGVSALNDFVKPPGETTSLSAATITGLALTAAIGVADIILNLKKLKYYDDFPVSTLRPGDLSGQALEAYDKAERMLAANKLEDAMDLYSRVCTDFRDSVYYPLSLYKIARIQFIFGELSLVGAELLLLKRKYPLPELYDKTCKTLADLYFRQGRYEDALAELNEMLLIDPLYPKESIDVYKTEILEGWYAEDPAVLDRALSAFLNLCSAYENSPNIDTYLFKAAYYLFRSDRREEALTYLNRITGPSDELGPSVDNLRGLLGGEQ